MFLGKGHYLLIPQAQRLYKRGYYINGQYKINIYKIPYNT